MDKFSLKLKLCGNLYQNPTNRKLLNPTLGSADCTQTISNFQETENVVFKYYFWTFLPNNASRRAL